MTELAPTLVTAAAAVTGTLVGGLTSFATSYFVQRRQGHAEHVLRDLERREDLYSRFTELAAQLVIDALDHELDDPAKLVGIETLTGRIRLTSSRRVLDAAQDVIAHIMASYARPPMNPRTAVLSAPHAIVDPIVRFTTACRCERLEMLRGL